MWIRAYPSNNLLSACLMMSSAIFLFRFFNGRVAHPASVCISIRQVFPDVIILVFLAFCICSAASLIVIWVLLFCIYLFTNISLEVLCRLFLFFLMR